MCDDSSVLKRRDTAIGSIYCTYDPKSRIYFRATAAAAVAKKIKCFHREPAVYSFSFPLYYIEVSLCGQADRFDYILSRRFFNPRGCPYLAKDSHRDVSSVYMHIYIYTCITLHDISELSTSDKLLSRESVAHVYIYIYILRRKVMRNLCFRERRGPFVRFFLLLRYASR